MEKTVTLEIPHKELELWNERMDCTKGDVLAISDNFPKDTNVRRWTADFGNGIFCDIKVNTGDVGEFMWCEGVFFRQIVEKRTKPRVDAYRWVEIGCTDVGDRLEGEYSVFVGNDTYTVLVKPQYDITEIKAAASAFIDAQDELDRFEDKYPNAEMLDPEDAERRDELIEDACAARNALYAMVH